ncbi:hypothetical protein CENDO_11105 [Corynebacterium endometrii]|uniref:Uncharacterized protein n=1 Tax=Corynebacterium endometrii TaxID=2488819 RepID=A0A4P7QI16_9CORY|nr:hypothetical protein CENDO_11105 [Corynebacterium endometrii]
MVAVWATASYPASASNQTPLVSGVPGPSVPPEGCTLWVRVGPVACLHAYARRFAGHTPILFPANKCGIRCMRLGTGVDVCNRPLNRGVVV